MVVKKHSFRFRIPSWLSGAPAKESLPRHPKDRSKSPIQSYTNVPIQRPSSPSVTTLADSPPSPTKTHVDPNAETQNHSPPHPTQPSTSSVIIESPVTIHSEPPFASTSPLPSLQPSTHADSPSHVYIVSSSPKTQPQSPSHLSPVSTQPASSESEQEKEKMVVSEPIPQEAELKVNSPLREIPKSPETSFRSERMSTQPEGSEQQASSVPSSSPVFKTEPPPQPHPSSPLVSKPNSEESTLPASSTSQEEKEKLAVAVAEPVTQEAEPKMKSPLKIIPKSPETSFLPERMSTQPEGSHQASSLPSSSLVSKSEPPSQPHPSSPLVLKPNTEESTLPASSTSKEGKEKMVEPVPQEAEPKMKSPLKIIPKSPETSSQPENLSTRLTPTLGDVERSTTTPKVPLEKTKSKFRETQGKEKVVHEAIKAGKAKDTTTRQQTRRTIASASGTKAKDPSTRAFRADKKQHGTQETVERKVMFVASNPSGKDIKVVNATDPGTRNVSTISPEKAPLQKGIKDDISKFVHKLASVNPTQPMDEKSFSVITLTGDNRGATMHLGSESTKKEGSIHIHRAYKTDPEESTGVTTDGEENAEEDSHNSKEQGEVGKAYVNSNIQSINNSVMFHGSITERDPGVEVSLPQNPIKLDDKPALETHRTEFNISRAQKSTYQPTVRRRCLRGLFLEPSENPDQPRRHGCKFSCGKNNEDIEIL